MSFVGMIAAYAGDENSIPAGWLLCDGGTYSIKQYPELYDILRDYYGKHHNSGQFYVPDLRGMFLRGVDSAKVNDPDGETRVDIKNPDLVVGRQVGSKQSDALQEHNHKYYIFPGNRGSIADGSYWAHKETETHGVNADARISSETRPKNIYVNYIICYRTK